MGDAFDITISVIFSKACPYGKKTKFKIREVANDGAGNVIVNAGRSGLDQR
jgi:hypothetical protein